MEIYSAWMMASMKLMRLLGLSVILIWIKSLEKLNGTVIHTLVILRQAIGLRRVIQVNKDFRIFSGLKGQSMSINKVAAILLGVLVVAVVFSVFTGSFDSVVKGFTNQLSYPSPN